MKRVLQIRNEKGDPMGGHVFYAPTLEALDEASAAVVATLPKGSVTSEVESEDLLQLPTPPEAAEGLPVVLA